MNTDEKTISINIGDRLSWIFIYRFKLIMEDFPAFFIALLKWKYRKSNFRHKIVSSRTDIVIEGFPRSANSFSARAFSSLNQSVRLADHTHSYAQVLRAIQLQKPVILLIRPPFETIVSLKSLELQLLQINNKKGVRDPYWDILYYTKFYRKLFKYRHKIYPALFQNVLDDFGNIVVEVNQMYGTDFIPFLHSSENVKEIFNTNNFHLSPSKERNEIKQNVESFLKQACYEVLFKKAVFVYEQWRAYAEQQKFKVV